MTDLITVKRADLHDLIGDMATQLEDTTIDSHIDELTAAVPQVFNSVTCQHPAQWTVDIASRLGAPSAWVEGKLIPVLEALRRCQQCNMDLAKSAESTS